MNILPGTLTPIGIVRGAASSGTTAPKAPGSPGIGSGSVALFDGRTPGKTPPDQIWTPVFPRILDDPGKADRPGSRLDLNI